MNQNCTHGNNSAKDTSAAACEASPKESGSEQISQHQSIYNDAKLPLPCEAPHDQFDLCRWEDEGGRCIENRLQESTPLHESHISDPNQALSQPDTLQDINFSPNNPKSFEEFWPSYLQAHSKPATRLVHYAGPFAGVGWAVGCVATGNPLWALAAPAVIYAPLFLSHWLIEGNQPKTFEHPLWSIAAEFKLVYLGLTGQLGEELKKHNITGRP